MSVDQPAVTGSPSAALDTPAAPSAAPRLLSPPGAASEALTERTVAAKPPVMATSRRQQRKAAKAAPRRGRRVKRVVRRIELWSVLKLSLVLYTCLYIAMLLAVAGLWGFLNSSGLVTKFESFMKDIGFDKWQFHGAQMFKGAAAGGAVLVLTVTLLTVLATGLVNVISELTGGIRFTVIEEDPEPRPSSRPRSAVAAQPVPAALPPIEPEPEWGSALPTPMKAPKVSLPAAPAEPRPAKALREPKPPRPPKPEKAPKPPREPREPRVKAERPPRVKEERPPRVRSRSTTLAEWEQRRRQGPTG